MVAVSTMLPAGYGRKVRAEWTIAPDTPGSVTNIFPIADIGRGDEWGSSLGGVTVSLGQNVLLASDGMRIFATPNTTAGAQLLTALDSSGDSYIELEVPNGETYCHQTGQPQPKPTLTGWTARLGQQSKEFQTVLYKILATVCVQTQTQQTSALSE